MPATTFNLTVHTQNLLEQAAPGCRVRLQLSKPDVDMDGLVLNVAPIEAVADTDGAAIIPLWPNALGVRGSRYLVTIRSADNSRALFRGRFYMPMADAELSSLLRSQTVALPGETAAPTGQPGVNSTEVNALIETRVAPIAQRLTADAARLAMLEASEQALDTRVDALELTDQALDMRLDALEATAGEGSGPAQGGDADTANLAQRLEVKPWDLAASSSGGGAPATFTTAGDGTTLGTPDAEGWQTLTSTAVAAPFMWASTGAMAVSGRAALRVRVPDNVANPTLYPALALLIVDGAASAATVMAAAATPGQSPGTSITMVQCMPQAQTFPATMAAQGLDLPLGASQPSPLGNAPAQPVSFPNVALGDVFRIGVDVSTGEVFIGHADGTEQSLGQSSLLVGKTSLQVISYHMFTSTPRTGSVQIDASAPLGATTGFGGGASIALPSGTLPGTLLNVVGSGRYRTATLGDKDIVLTLAEGDIKNLGQVDLSAYATKTELTAALASIKPQPANSDAMPYAALSLVMPDGKIKRVYPGAGINFVDQGGYVEIQNGAPDTGAPGDVVVTTNSGYGVPILAGKQGNTAYLHELVAGPGVTLDDAGGAIRITASVSSSIGQGWWRFTPGTPTRSTTTLYADKVGYVSSRTEAAYGLVVRSDDQEVVDLGSTIPAGHGVVLFFDDFDVSYGGNCQNTVSVVADGASVIIDAHNGITHIRPGEVGLLLKKSTNRWQFINLTRPIPTFTDRVYVTPTDGAWLKRDANGGIVVLAAPESANWPLPPISGESGAPRQAPWEVTLFNPSDFTVTLVPNWTDHLREKTSNYAIGPWERVRLVAWGDSWVMYRG